MKEKIQKFLYSNRGENFKNFIFGFQDGLITTYILLCGIAILVLFNPILLIITLIAEVAAGAISMMFGAYVSAKTKNETINKLKKEKSESFKEKNIQEFFIKEGYSSEEIKIIEKFLKKNPTLCKKLVFSQDNNLSQDDPINTGIYMGIAFIFGGMIPIIPYFIPTPMWSFLLATVFSFLALFLIGVFRSFYSEKHWLKPALEMILIGILAIIIIEIYLYFIILTYGMIILA
ncbi:MAG: VIT1/CCC1 transporter family protein [Promethearchaeota archaeon]